MTNPQPARPTFDAPARRQVLGGVFAVVLLAGILAFPRGGATLDPFTANGWTTMATPSVDVVRRGDRISFVVTVSAAKARTGLVDIEVNDAGGRKVFQDFWDNRSFAAGVPVTFTTTWQVPAGEPLGEHVVRIGIFRVGWGVLYHWHHVAATFDVAGAGAPVPTTTTTPAPTTTRPPAVTTTTKPPAVTTTTKPPAVTTTTKPPAVTTTTTPPAVTTTTTPPTSTTTPPAGTQFTARFETAADFYDRFVAHVGNACNASQTCRPESLPPSADPILEWPGDHSMACAGPETQRPVHVANHAEMFWHCAPGEDPAKGHVMTSLNTSGYAIVSFSPDQTFHDVTRICWDINLTDLGGGKWTNVIVVPESEYVRHPNPNPKRDTEGEGPYRMDYTTPGFNDEGSVGDFSLQTHDLLPGGRPWGLKNFRGTLMLFHGDDVIWERGVAETTTDKAARYQHCIVENPNGTVTIIRDTFGVPESFTVTGEIPDGNVRVIFQDDNYDPPKRDGFHPDNNTWHWDNVTIS